MLATVHRFHTLVNLAFAWTGSVHRPRERRLANATNGPERSGTLVIWARCHARSLSQLVDAITLDAYGTNEQLTGVLTVFSEHVALPVRPQVLEVEVEALGFDLEEMSAEASWHVAGAGAGTLVWCRSPMSASSLGWWRRRCTPP